MNGLLLARVLFGTSRVLRAFAYAVLFILWLHIVIEVGFSMGERIVP